MKILIIEDNIINRKALIEDLSKHQFIVEAISDFNCLEALDYSPYQLIILDIRLPNYNGIDLISQIKQSSQAKIFMLTSDERKTTEYESVIRGADDYLTKPHYLPLLLHKINLINDTNILMCHGHEINLHTMRIDQKIKLTKQEYQVLIYLINHQNQYCTKNQLLELLWENNFFVEVDALYSLIYRLRKKLDPTQIKIINHKGAYCIHV